MSLIAYADNTLLADRVGEKLIAEISYFKEIHKLHINPSKLFAFAYCGDAFLDRQLTTFHDILLTLLIQSFKDGLIQNLFIPSEHQHLFGSRSIILMTKDQVFVRNHESEQFVEIETTDWQANGTYHASFRFAWGFGLDVVKAAKEAVKFAGGRDSPIDSVTRSHLKSFKKVKK